MHIPTPARNTRMLHRIVACVLPLVMGMGSSFVLLLVAGGPAGQVYAGTLTFPGACGRAQPGDQRGRGDGL